MCQQKTKQWPDGENSEEILRRITEGQKFNKMRPCSLETCGCFFDLVTRRIVQPFIISAAVLWWADCKSSLLSGCFEMGGKHWANQRWPNYQQTKTCVQEDRVENSTLFLCYCMEPVTQDLKKKPRQITLDATWLISQEKVLVFAKFIPRIFCNRKQKIRNTCRKTDLSSTEVTTIQANDDAVFASHGHNHLWNSMITNRGLVIRTASLHVWLTRACMMVVHQLRF